MQAQGDDVYKFEEAMQANRDDATPDDDEADRNVLSKCQDANNRNSLHFAAHAGSAGVVEYVLKKNPGMIDNRDLDGATALVLALMKEHSEVANLLLDLGADGTVASHDGTSALHHASGIGDAATVRRLLEAGANLEGGSPSGTPLHWAAGEGALGALKVLLEAGANPNAPDPRGVPALAMAVVRGAEECCTLLLGASADCTASLPGGMLPLHVAADMGNSVLVERLLAACPEAANVLDEQGNSALSLATTAGHEAIVALLEPATTVQGVTPVDDSFLEVDSFDGSRPGYVFKMGERGLGYYKETPKAAPERIKPEVQIAPEAATAAMQLKAKGNEHLKAKQLEEAEEAYSGAIALDHTQHTFFTNRSLCRLKRGDKEGALADAEAAKELAPEDVKVRWRLGAALEALDRYVDASGEYYEGLKLDMDNTEMKKAFEKAVARGKQSHAFKTYNQ